MTQYDDIQRNATTGGGEGDPASPVGDIEVYVEQILEGYGTTHYDLDNMPSSASGRPNGMFSDYHDLERYLDGGALVLRDENGEPIPNPVVHIYIHEDEFYDGNIYEVWIDDDTP